MQTKNSISEQGGAGSDMLSLKSWRDPHEDTEVVREAFVDCGWGRFLFGQTFGTPSALAGALNDEASAERDIALYVREPHVVLAAAPQQLFLDPSHTYRLDLARLLDLDAAAAKSIRSATPDDADEINRLYLSRSMLPLREGYLAEGSRPGSVCLLVAESPGGAFPASLWGSITRPL